MGLVENLAGDFLGFARCPVTGDTYWRTEMASVPYSEVAGLLVSARALTEVPHDTIAQRAYEHGMASPNPERKYTLGEIRAQIPQGCMTFPRSSEKIGVYVN